MHIAGQRITEERARALFRQPLELVEQNEARNREQLKSTVPRKRLPAALSKLSPRELAALLLYKFEGLSSLDIGQVLGLMQKRLLQFFCRSTPSCGISQTLSLLNVATLPCKRDNR